MPALVAPAAEVALVLVLVLAPALDMPLVPVAAPGDELLLVAAVPAEAAGETAAEARGDDVVVVEAVPPRPNVTAPVASWTLMGGGGITPLRICEVTSDEVEVEVVLLTPALADGAAPVVPVVPAAPVLAAAPVLVVPVAPVAPVVEPPTAQAALVVPVVVAPLGEAAPTTEGRTEADDAGEALVAPVTPVPAEAAALGRAEVMVAAGALAAGLAPVAGLVLVAGLAAPLGGPA